MELVDRIGVGGVERQRDHRLDLAQVHLDAAVVVGDVCRVERFVVVGATVQGEEVADAVIGGPDAGEAGGLGRHDVDAGAVLRVHARNARAHELHDSVFDVAALEDGADNRQRDVLRADPRRGLAGEVDGNDLGVCDVIGVAQQLLDELAAALADGHGAQGAVAGVGVAAEDHLAAAGELLAHELVDDGHVGRDVDAAVLLGGGQAKEVVVVVDGAADRAQGVVAAGQGIGEGELLHAAGACRLHDADVGDVVAGHGVEADLEVVHGGSGVVVLEDAVGDGAASCLGLVGGLAAQLLNAGGLALAYELGAVNQVHAFIVQVDHEVPPHVADLPILIPAIVGAGLAAACCHCVSLPLAARLRARGWGSS